jgi:hypothetical protein
MKLSDQVITLEQAKRLKELGIDQQNATYYFYEQIVNGKTSYPIKPMQIIAESPTIETNEELKEALSGKIKNEVYAAFTVAELGQLLPDDVGNQRYLLFDKFKGVYRSWYGESVFHHLHEQKSASEAQSRAAMLIYLLENKII